MSDYYAIEIRVNFAVLADSEDEAEAMARGLVEIEDAPSSARVSYDTKRTLNQSDDIKRGAVNYE